jgi:hypothetical protein
MITGASRAQAVVVQSLDSAAVRATSERGGVTSVARCAERPSGGAADDLFRFAAMRTGPACVRAGLASGCRCCAQVAGAFAAADRTGRYRRQVAAVTEWLAVWSAAVYRAVLPAPGAHLAVHREGCPAVAAQWFPVRAASPDWALLLALDADLGLRRGVASAADSLSFNASGQRPEVAAPGAGRWTEPSGTSLSKPLRLGP